MRCKFVYSSDFIDSAFHTVDVYMLSHQFTTT